jgi:hypothetical protein
VEGWIKWKSMYQVPAKCWKLHTNTRYHNLKDHYLNKGGHAVAQLVQALHYKPEGRGFNSWWCHWKFSLTFQMKLYNCLEQWKQTQSVYYCKKRILPW